MKIRVQSVRTLQKRALQYALQKARHVRFWFRSRMHLVRDNPIFYANWALLGLVLYLAVVVILTTTADPEEVSAMPMSVEEPVEVTTEQPSIRPLNDYLQLFRRRQIFRAASRPGKAEATTPKRAEETAEQLAAKITIVGVFFDDDPVALLRVQGTEESRRYRSGEEILGMTIARIEKRSVFLTDGQNEYELKL